MNGNMASASGNRTLAMETTDGVVGPFGMLFDKRHAKIGSLAQDPACHPDAAKAVHSEKKPNLPSMGQ